MKYKIIKQKPYCCVGACMEMILNRRNITSNGQVEIACELGLIVPLSYKSMYPNAIIGDKPNAGFGTQIQKEEYSINRFFKNNNLDLVLEYSFFTSISKVKKFLLQNSCNDIIICLYGEILYDDKDANWGHMVLFDEIKNDIVTLVDSYKNRHLKMPINKLVQAIKVHGEDNGAGFYLIK